MHQKSEIKSWETVGKFRKIKAMNQKLQQFNRRVGNQIYTRKLATGIPGYSTRFDAKN